MLFNMVFNPLTGSDAALLITEQLLVFATVVGSVGALPSFIEFMTERRKRRERIDLSLEDEPVEALQPRLAGMNELLQSIEDLVDRARHPEVYEDLKIGNEVLIIGPHQSGKKSLAQKIAKLTGMERLVTVYNPRDSDALAQAKSLVRSYKWQKIMLLLPRIDLAYKESDPEVLAELDALIESTSERANVLVIATATTFVPDSDLDNSFGIKLVLPGAEVLETDRREIPEDAQRMFAAVAEFYLGEARRRGFVLEGITEQEFCGRILEGAMNPAEIEDIVVLCETTALFRRRTRQSGRLVINPEILDTAIGRVIVG
ncbi:ATP-binding protein [Acidipila sp. EB88]|uniref:ATP-binding protein n=1 Tax=Acidipila sp. EB88 TaxID=2305226 RepID=UPI000F5DB1D2|nr:ATP-binding protein [Acidipila sp. EB88]RRA47233.1 ATP-binding protein [Acidipila sp. EB88]